MEKFLNLLVSKLTGLESNDPTLTNLFGKAKYTIKYSKCTSTSEKEVNDSFNGLADKFVIKGRHEISKVLLKYKQDFLNTSATLGSFDSNQRILKYDMLKLLLCLSSSLPSEPYVSGLVDRQEEPQVSWSDIIRDEPLDGDHWKSWSDDENSIEQVSDEDLFEVDQGTSELTERDTVPNELEVNFFERMEVDDRGDPDTLKHLTTQQYWRSDFYASEEYSPEHSMFQNPCSMNSALSETVYRGRYAEAPGVINEADVIREILFLLNGHSGIIFQYSNQHQGFQLNKNYVVRHLSQGALGSLLNEFCEFGTILSNLRQLTLRILSEDFQYGQTAQAFATVVYRSLLNFEGQLSESEKDTSFITKDQSKVISVLKLRNDIQTRLQCFQEIYDITTSIPFDNGSPGLIAYHLISTLYERTLNNHFSGQNTLYDTTLYIFQQTIVPFGYLMDDWMFRGSLEGDRLNEFYVKKNDDVPMDGPNLWTDGFSIQLASQDSVCFSCPLFEKRNIDRIFFTGKAVNLLLKIEKIRNEQVYFGQEPVAFSEIMKSYLPVKQSFINVMDDGPKKQQDETYDIFTRYLSSMASLSRKSAHEDVYESDANYIGFLFDQSFIQYTEQYIQKPYINTANRLNSVLHNNCGLLVQLNSLSSVYLMLNNDMMHSFYEAIFTQMDNKESWFDKRSLNGTFIESCESNGYEESIYVEMESQHLRNQTGTSSSRTMVSMLQFISFKIPIPWPLNNFIQEHTLIQYSKVARLLLRLKRAKHVLEKKILFKGKQRYEKNSIDSTWFYAARMKMLWFVNTFWQYIMITVLDVETIKFRQCLNNSTDADEITLFHTAYINQIIDKCMLNEKSTAVRVDVMKILDMTEDLVDIFLKYIYTTEHSIKRSYQESKLEDFIFDMSALEQEFIHTNESVLNGLINLSKRSGLSWYETLATSLNAQQPTNN